MTLKCVVKLTSVNNLSDARYAAGMGVEMLGFDLNPNSPRWLPPEQFEAITGWVSGVKLVGELSDTSQVKLTEITQNYKLDMIQCTVSDHSEIPETELPLLLKLDPFSSPQVSSQLKTYDKMARYFLLPQSEGGLPEKEIIEWAAQYPIILEGNFTPQRCEYWLNKGVIGFSLSGGDEIKPGYKDFDDLADILEFLELD